nr:phage tail protein [Streptococcus uberis]
MHETAVADNALLNAIKINKASLTSFFEEATHQVEFEFSKESGEWWGIKENGYLAFRFLGDFFRFSIVKFKENAKSKTISIIGDYFNLEMLSENCLAYENQPARTIVEHLTAMEFFPYANFEIGVNELATSKKTLKYEGEDVKYKRLISIINNFGGECEFEIKQKRNGQFDKLILNIYRANDGVNYQGVGRNRRDFEITIDNSNDVSRTFDMTDIKTAIEPIGKDGLRLGNRGTVWRNEQGQTEFYQKNNRIYAPIAAENMPKVLDIDDYLLWKLNVDTDDVAKLESEGLKWLKNICYGKETIEVSGSFDVRVGDTVILNHKGIGRYGILGSLRVMKITWNLLTGTNEVTFSNFKRLASRISAQGLALQDTIESPASYDIAFNTTAGTVFKNNTGVSTVSFNFFKNGTQTAVFGQRWYNGTQLLSNGLEVTIKPDMLTDGKLNLRLEVDVTDAITFSKELTFINVNDGLNGSKGADGNGIASSVVAYQAGTSATVAPTGTWSSSPVSVPAGQFLWTRTIFTYTDTTTKTIYNVSRQGQDGAKGADGIAGKDGVGISSTVTTYGLSANETTQPTTWTSSVPTLVKGQYLWTKTVWTYTDAKTETGYTKTYIAKDGNNGSDGIAGKDGVGILSTSITYQASTSGTVVPTSTWSSQVPSVPNGQFLWTRTVWNYTDSTSETGYSVAKMGTDGINGKDGQNGQIPHIAYADKSTDVLVDAMPTLGKPSFYSGATGTVSPISGGYKYTTTGGTNNMKQVISFNGTSGKNVYTYLKIKNTHATNDLVIGFNGLSTTLNGYLPMVTVKPNQTYVEMRPLICRDTYDFVQINISATTSTNDLSYEIYEYALYNSLPFVNFTIGTNTNSQYIGMYVDTVVTDSTDPTKYNWSLIKGQDGAQGIQGPPGADGKTPYWHTAWANSSDGKTDFSLTDSKGKQFRGEYIDYIQSDSTDPTKYNWIDRTSNVKVGGSNIFLNSRFENTSTDTNSFTVGGVTYNTKPDYWALYNSGLPNPTTSYHAYVDSVFSSSNVIAFNESDGSRNWKAINQTISSRVPKTSSDFTISFDVYATDAGTKAFGGFYYTSKSKGTSAFHAGQFTIVPSSVGKWVRESARVPFDANDCDFTKEIRFYIYGYGFTTNSILYIDKVMLENSTVASVHSDAPEELKAIIDANQALTQAQMLALEERSALARDNAIAEAMKNTISEVEAKWQTWYNLNTADEKQKVANDIASLFERVAEFKEDLGEASAKFSFINNETLIGEEGVAIGDKEGKAKLFLSNDSISFVTNGVAQMTLTGDTLTIKNGLFTERIQIGNYVEEVYDRNPLYNIIRPIKHS